ncbi:DoxX family protein [Streptomyces sp. 7R007]
MATTAATTHDSQVLPGIHTRLARRGLLRAPGPIGMTTAHISLAVALSLIFFSFGLAKIAAVPFMRQAAAHLGMSLTLDRVIGALEVAGAADLLLGLALAPLGMAAAAGLTVLMMAAAVVHLRHGEPPVRAAPAAVLAPTAMACAGVAIAAG